VLLKLQIADPVINKKKYYTTAALKDELTKQLSSRLETSGNTENNDENTVYKYHKYAQKLLYEINLLTIFEINVSDLSQELVQELQMLHEEILNEIIIDAISRLYESVNFDYFHTVEIRGKIKWRFVK
jgi:hypothetical protein